MVFHYQLLHYQFCHVINPKNHIMKFYVIYPTRSMREKPALRG